MRFLHALVGLVLFVLFAAFGAFLVYAATGGNAYWAQIVTGLMQERWAVLGAGVSIVLLIMLYLLTSVSKAEPAHFISFESEGGSVSISVKAVRDFIQKVGDEFASVLSIHPVINVRGGAMEIDLDLRIKSGAHIPELCSMIQERVKESIRDSLGLADVRKVRVNVREIVGPVTAAGTAPEAARETQTGV